MTSVQFGAFQSTPPVWGATQAPEEFYVDVYISIHAPRVGGDKQLLDQYGIMSISIHAPRVGGDG